MLKRIIFALALLLAVPAFFAGHDVHAAENTTITLHKRIYRDARLSAVADWQFANQGQEIALGDESFGLNGVNFAVYDATTLYDQAKQEDETRSAFAQRLAKMSNKAAQALAAKHDLPLVTTLKTQTVGEEDGIAQLQVPPRQDAAYLLIEVSVDRQEQLDVDLTKKACPILVSLPVVVNGQALSQIHVYPKNVGYVRDPFFFKYGVRLDGSRVRLAGAVFALYRLDEAGNKLYLDLSPVVDLKNNWVRSADPLNDPNVNLFISDKNGLVDTAERFLPSGTFYFEELKAPDGYQKLEKPVKVVVPASWYDEDGHFLPVLINGTAMPETDSGVVQAATIAAGRPGVDNFQKATSSTTDNTQPSSPAQDSNTGSPGTTSFLPSMGAPAAWLAVALGTALILSAWLLHKRRQAHDNQ